MNQQTSSSSVVVSTSARLHMGFFDLNGQTGRRFGSLGLSLDAPNTIIELTEGDHALGEAKMSDYVHKSLHAILAHANIKQKVSIKVNEQIPRHYGLGSGTQMALAIGAGVNKLFGLKMTLSEIAHIVGRGLRSGIGIGTFEYGGLVLDGGRGKHTSIPPIITRQAFPESWRILLIFDQSHTGVHGVEEQKAFASLKDASLQATEKVSHQILMQALPALAEKDLTGFGSAIGALQAYTGDYFAPVQGGRYASPRVAQVLNDLAQQGILCSGQSSWGPTGFAIFENRQEAEQYVTRLTDRFSDFQLNWKICAARNEGANIKIRTDL